MPSNRQLRRALDEHLGQQLTPELAARIALQCDDLSLAQDSKPDDVVRARLLDAFAGREDAADLVLLLASIAHTWDDLIDRDRPVLPQGIHRAFTNAVIGLNLNPFFRAHCAALLPVLNTGILNWHAANELENDGRLESLEVAHVVRCAVGDVALLIAEICGGRAHAMSHAAGLRMLTQQDSLASYLRDFKEAGNAA